VLTACRVFVTSHRVIAFRSEGHIERVLDVELTTPFSVEAARGTLQGALDVQTPEGVLWINRGGGCGCGSPLQALEPPVDWQGNVASVERA
jgi:hypothetical protein